VKHPLKSIKDKGTSVTKENDFFQSLSLSHEKSLLLEKHLSLLIKANAGLNLTRITSFDEGKVLHVEDSLSALSEIEAAPKGLYADLGTGGGYPGIPLAIVTGRETLLVESSQKKAVVLEELISSLDLQNNVSVYTGRIEELSMAKPCEFAAVTARALTSLPSLLELASPPLMLGGRCICFKSQNIEDEFMWALGLQKRLGMSFVSKRDFLLSDGLTKRCIVVFEKTAEAETKLPRRPGMAQKRPYVS
jgi:16S rRNA (guanine527-N7)-methyltransferase